MRLPSCLVVFGLAPLAGCMMPAEPVSVAGAGGAAVATGQISSAVGDAVGSVRVAAMGQSLEVTADVSGMAPGSYGAHVHAVGQCTGPSFTTAGPHWNPTMREHGRLNPAGSHHGDLPNIMVGADGRGQLRATIAGDAASLLDADGAAVVIHAMPDDQRTDPSGNSGARIACAVLSAPTG